MRVRLGDSIDLRFQKGDLVSRREEIPAAQ
jgi:hypothetical protein